MKILCRLVGHKEKSKEYEYHKKLESGTYMESKMGICFMGTDKTMKGSQLVLCSRCGEWRVEIPTKKLKGKL